MSVFFSLLGVREIADRYGTEEVIEAEVLLEVEVLLADDEVEGEGEAVVVDGAGSGSLWMATVHILGGALTVEA
ncbi:hypothetical protein E2C01_050774 [Portunus trituberculatus]|uniref:Uncharacterized protein n=1 Tax=Portunus trituberculatus TaxID=210409 RepID=A0A5B7GIF1_PORTR|nr:hypothetical protein [Portunus trituberculatus]